MKKVVTQSGFSLVEAMLLLVICSVTMFTASVLSVKAAESLRAEELELQIDHELKRADILLADPSVCALNFADLRGGDTAYRASGLLRYRTTSESELSEDQKAIDSLMEQSSILFSDREGAIAKLEQMDIIPSEDIPDLRILNLTFLERREGVTRTYVRTLPLHVRFSGSGVLETCSSMPRISTDTGTCTPPTEVTTSRCEAGGARVSVEQFYRFPSVQGCAWGVDGNLSRSTGALARARREHYLSLNIPANAEVCRVQFSFRPNRVVYDDEFYFTFNGVVLAASAGPSVSRYLPSQGGYYLWDWSAVAGKTGVVVEGGSRSSYCADAPEIRDQMAALTVEYDRASTARRRAILQEMNALRAAQGNTCVWPGTQRSGTINMRFTSATFTEIYKANPTNRSGFGMITLGNAHSYDCAQSGIEFDATIEYAE